MEGERLRTDLPDLAGFLGGYFHQDWTLDHQSADEVIEVFRADVDDETRERLNAQIDMILAEESEVTDTMLYDLRCSYVTWSDGF